MDIKTNIKVEISFPNIIFNKIRSAEKEKTDYCTNKEYLNGSHKYERAINSENFIHCRDINSPPNRITNCNYLLGFGGNCIKMTITEE